MPLCQCNFYAKTLGFCVNISVYIPGPRRSHYANMSLDEIYSPVKKYKTLYLLHGMYEDDSTWLRKSNIERYAEEKQIAVVMPSVQNSYYADMKYGPDYFTYLTEELPRLVCNLFPLSDKREDTFIAGLSMGGYGACKAAFARPERYGAFASLSGAVDIEGILQYIEHIEMSEEATEAKKLFTAVFGSLAEYKNSTADLFYQSEQLKDSGKSLPRAYIACGMDDKLCYPMNRKLTAHLSALGIPVTYEEGPGDHNWDFWDVYIKKVLDWLVA